MTITITIIFFIFGLIIGSFLNVIIFRFNTHRSFGGRSGCMTCQKQLRWYELIPLFSYLGLKGRCSGCKTKISKQYFWVELLTGIIFAGLFLKFQNVFFGNT
ncbi:MAG: prepilin peptidase, partial [Patescibacteria group bacterium]